MEVVESLLRVTSEVPALSFKFSFGLFVVSIGCGTVLSGSACLEVYFSRVALNSVDNARNGFDEGNTCGAGSCDELFVDCFGVLKP